MSARISPASPSSEASIDARTTQALAWLRAHASDAARDGMARFAIPSDHALGVSMKDIQALAKQLGRDHALADALWDTGVYEARMLAAYVAEPARVTPAQMDRWCRDFDNWAVCDTLCFTLFDRTPHAFAKVVQWSSRRDEFQKRAAFALLASLALHGRLEDEALYADGLALIEREAADERNFVKKGVNWALRAIGRRADWRAEATAVAKRLAASDAASARWIGKDALREFAKQPPKPAKKAQKKRPEQHATTSASKKALPKTAARTRRNAD
ncbi:DNA alkylation repair protein [Lysobacter auxotrophicus]|uniref:DNA alkylation repair protein n=1 Tax=Lysobacter auxotrophicus TaxID=2992573 RepID=A0ABN6UKK7_9GAMM|nr:DNA alkylation repair protein [Lysobacter auxotrophicus]BDU16805.1 DNA alkylation repair protein [Lysobacter auxotrophicus]